MAKTKYVVHKFFHQDPVTKSYLCKFCSWKTTNNATRMLKHISTKCTKVPMDTKMKYSNIKKEPIQNGFNETSDTPTSSASSSKVSAHNNKPSDIESVVYDFDAVDSSQIDELLARMIFSTGMSTSIVKNIHWIQLITGLNPTYTLPTPEIIRGELLDNEAMRLQIKGDAMIAQAEFLGLMCDTWKNKNDCGLNIIITTPSPVFVKYISTSKNYFTSDFIANQIKQVICAYGSSKFFGITINNINEMNTALVLVREEYPHLIVYGCLADKINDFLNEGFNLQTIKTLINEGEILVEAFIHHQEMKLRVPTKSRWISIMNFLERLLENKRLIKELSATVKMSVHSIISNEPFWRNISSFYNFFLSISNFIKKIEKESSNLSEAYVFYEIKKQFEKFLQKIDLSLMEKNKFNEIMETRKVFKLSLVHKSAYMLDPRYHGEKLMESEKLEIFEFLKDVAEHFFTDPEMVNKFIEQYLEYKSREGLFAKKNLWDKSGNMEPRKWWMNFFDKTVLSEISIRILMLPLTSAACDRSLNLLCETFGDEIDGKLIYVRHNLKVIGI